ncbi:pilus assembly protein TadG-related protein [Bradyrhizobium sp. 2TAF24]|uniref:TadE/TadG family type IV pilus assembly protein n=1 Tax=Bradyrhizobium sp. 2TAF24 TaxID=3233011 RepID=UPI003F8F33F8
MTRVSITAKLRRMLARFCRAERGNVAVTFALTIVPIMGCVGAAIDYTRVNSARTAMQDALDAAVLMVAKDDSTGTLTPAQLNAKAQAYFSGLYGSHPEVIINSVSATYSGGSGAPSTILLNGSGTLPTQFASVLGFSSLNFSVSSTATWGLTKLRVSLVLDNTGSMNDAGKLVALQGAANTLIDQLSASAQKPGDVYISVVPFAKDVNVGASNYTQNWIKWNGASDTWEENNGSCSRYFGFYRPTSLSACQSVGGTWKAANHSNWTGCVMDRDQNYDTTNTAPTSVATDFPADEYYENGTYFCAPGANPALQPITPLSYNWTMLKASINAMQATGGTNQAIGLAWGWMSLTQSSPLNAPALDPNYSYVQAIILLSDGLNTEDRWYGDGVDWSSQVDARQQTLCDNIKAAGIKIYAIQVNTDGEAQSAVMAYCASDPGKFFYLTSATQVLSTFNTIGASLAQLRISR